MTDLLPIGRLHELLIIKNAFDAVPLSPAQQRLHDAMKARQAASTTSQAR